MSDTRAAARASAQTSESQVVASPRISRARSRFASLTSHHAQSILAMARSVLLSYRTLSIDARAALSHSQQLGDAVGYAHGAYADDASEDMYSADGSNNSLKVSVERVLFGVMNEAPRVPWQPDSGRAGGMRLPQANQLPSAGLCDVPRGCTEGSRNGRVPTSCTI